MIMFLCTCHNPLERLHVLHKKTACSTRFNLESGNVSFNTLKEVFVKPVYIDNMRYKEPPGVFSLPMFLAFVMKYPAAQ